MLLIERYYGHGQVIRSASRQIGLVITLWAFGAMLLGMCYSGNIVSELTSPSLPDCPHDMQSLSEINEFPVFSDLTFFNGRTAPFFHEKIQTYLAAFDDTDGSLLPKLRKFGKTLTFVDGSSPELTPSNYNTSSKTLLAYGSSTPFVYAYGIWNMMRSKRLRVLHGGDLPFFESWTPISVQSNFLSPILQRLLGNLCQCGTWKYWSDRCDAMFVKAKLVGLVLQERDEEIMAMVEEIKPCHYLAKLSQFGRG